MHSFPVLSLFIVCHILHSAWLPGYAFKHTLYMHCVRKELRGNSTLPHQWLCYSFRLGSAYSFLFFFLLFFQHSWICSLKSILKRFITHRYNEHEKRMKGHEVKGREEKEYQTIKKYTFRQSQHHSKWMYIFSNKSFINRRPHMMVDILFFTLPFVPSFS